MPYWRLFYHLVWTTKKREPLLTPGVEQEIYGLLCAKAVGLGGTVFAIGGVEDHMHLVVSIPPSLAVAMFVGQVKGVASTKFNKAHPLENSFAWQEEYGAFSFDAKRLPPVVAYVERQKEHHALGTTIKVLEAWAEDMHPAPQGTLLREQDAAYEIDELTWRREMETLG